MLEIVKQINKTLEIKEELLQKVTNEEELINLLSLYIQELINKDFEHLLWLLYRIDVGETKVKKAIQEAGPEKTPKIIAQLILEREKEKIKTRKKYSSNDTNEWIF